MTIFYTKQMFFDLFGDNPSPSLKLKTKHRFSDIKAKEKPYFNFHLE